MPRNAFTHQNGNNSQTLTNCHDIAKGPLESGNFDKNGYFGENGKQKVMWPMLPLNSDLECCSCQKLSKHVKIILHPKFERKAFKGNILWYCTVPQMILDRKWSPKSTANDPVKNWGMWWILWDWLQKRTDYEKGTSFSRLLKKKGRRTPYLRSIYKAKKKWNKSEKDMVSTASLVNCFKFLSRMFLRCKNLRQAGHRKN